MRQIQSNELGQQVGFALKDWKPPPFPSREPMEGRLCRLDAFDPGQDVDKLYSAYAADRDGKNWTYLAYGPFDDVAGFRAWVDRTCLSNDPLFFTIRRTSDGEPVGMASYLRISPAAGSIEVGHIHFAPALQRHPAATEAMYLMMKRAFELGYRRYEWKCDSLNAPSRAAAQRLGLSFEGIFRQATVYKSRNRDTAWYAAIDSEWPVLRDAFERWLDPGNFDDNGLQRVRLSELTGPVLKRRH